ncbi:MAG: hypothetical protein AB1796_06715 [Bacillota bacterium]
MPVMGRKPAPRSDADGLASLQSNFAAALPLHIGCGKIGNLQRTRTYVTGRALWGAITMRLTRDRAWGGVAADDSRVYQDVSGQVCQSLAFTYFFPALRSGNTYQVAWPWEEERAFRCRFLSSYAATALDYPQQSAAFGMLHEAEFISPCTLDRGEPVFLQGYIFEKEKCSLPWQATLKRLQLGGERGYGWGDVKVIEISESKGSSLFGTEVKFQDREEAPLVSLPASARLLAHAVTDDVAAAGEVEPLVGREWRTNQARNCYAGQHIAFNGLCFVPGSILNEPTEFLIGRLGIWRRLKKTG